MSDKNPLYEMFKLLDEPGSWAIRKEGEHLWIEESGFIDRIPSMHPPMTFIQAVDKLLKRLKDPNRTRMPPFPYGRGNEGSPPSKPPYLDVMATEGCKTTKSQTET
jgi:hypothetical protein